MGDEGFSNLQRKEGTIVDVLIFLNIILCCKFLLCLLLYGPMFAFALSVALPLHSPFALSVTLTLSYVL